MDTRWKARVLRFGSRTPFQLGWCCCERPLTLITIARSNYADRRYLSLYSFGMFAVLRLAFTDCQCTVFSWRRGVVVSGVRLVSSTVYLQSYLLSYLLLLVFHHPLSHSRLKSFLFCKSSLPQPFLFLLQDSLYGFPILFTVTSEHIRLLLFSFYVFTHF